MINTFYFLKRLSPGKWSFVKTKDLLGHNLYAFRTKKYVLICCKTFKNKFWRNGVIPIPKITKEELEKAWEEMTNV